jgi:hypothetical protein
MSAIMHVFAEGSCRFVPDRRAGLVQRGGEDDLPALRAGRSRHLGFGVMHLKYIRTHGQREELHHYLTVEGAAGAGRDDGRAER